jgi:hypothetical protein
MKKSILLILIIILSLIFCSCGPDIKIEDIEESDYSGVSGQLGFSVGWVIEKSVDEYDMEIMIITVVSEKFVYFDISYSGSVSDSSGSSSTSSSYSSSFPEKGYEMDALLDSEYNHYDVTIRVSKKYNPDPGEYLEICCEFIYTTTNPDV